MLGEAYQDLKYLLNRGYRKSYALEFIANHYRLTLGERHLLARCVFPDSWIKDVKEKLLQPEDLKGLTLAIDGFNVLITIESLLEGKAILCEDGLVRDLKHQGRYRLNERTSHVLKKVVSLLRGLDIGEAVFFYGKNVQKSGIVKALTERALEEKDLPGRVHLVKSPDFELKRFEFVATADAGIVVSARGVFDIPAELGRRMGLRPTELFNLFSRQFVP